MQNPKTATKESFHKQHNKDMDDRTPFSNWRTKPRHETQHPTASAQNQNPKAQNQKTRENLNPNLPVSSTGNE